MQRDLAEELIGIRRSLPPAVGMAARFGTDPSDGMVVAVPEDPSWQVAVGPLEQGWSVAEVHLLPGALGQQRRDLAEVSAADAPIVVAEHFRRLQLLVRNAACGTPLDRR